MSRLTENRIDHHVKSFIKKLNKEFGKRQSFDIDKGNNYARIVAKSNFGDSRSAWGFIALKDNPKKGYKEGDLLKSAGWKAPAKHPRGNIIDGTAKYGEYGPEYLR